MAAAKPALEVWKFGGASLADGEAIKRAAARIAAHSGPLVIVASALGGMTDLLLDAADHAVAGRLDDAYRAAETFRAGHRAAAKVAIKDRAAVRAIGERIDRSAADFAELCRAVAVLRHLEARPRDAMVCRGEQLSATLLAAAEEPSA